MNNLSLLNIIHDDPEFGKRIAKKVHEIKKDKANIMELADTYGGLHRNEIMEGTLKRAKLLSEGKERGLTEQEILSCAGFYPTIQTPILNLLYFLLRESENDPYYGNRNYQTRDRINEILVRENQLDHEDGSEDIDSSQIDSILDELQKTMYSETKSEEKRTKINTEFNKEKETRPVEEKTELKEAPDMVEYLYGEATLEQFSLIKKLKALTTSPNINEAAQAFIKGRELCNKCGLDWEKIPCYIDKRK